MKKLLIVESPAKARAIKSYVGSDVEVLASIGHVRDLATSKGGGLGVDIYNNFEPEYEITTGKEKVVQELKKAAQNKLVILATDPDREGEAIAWHLAQVLGLNLLDKNRVEFKEITKQSVLKEISNLKTIDINLVESQETRRIIDRIIGFRLSSLVKKKIKARSAGRVQSVALKLVVELENEIQKFIPEDYFDIKVVINKTDFKYIKKHNNLIKQEEASLIEKQAIIPYLVVDRQVRERISKPRPAYITSTLQQDANNLLGFRASRTMKAAQQLYEGVEVEGELTGLITYMRTDSNRISSEFLFKARNYIDKTYGKEYLGFYQVSTKGDAQDAHEAIRPTDIHLTPEKVEAYLTKDQFRVYTLIYERTLEALMANSKYEITQIIIESNNHQFQAEGSIQTFKGFTIVKNNNKDILLPNLLVGDVCRGGKLILEPKQTTPPVRYSEASLIKELERLGIGRPSTYSHIMSTLSQRDYVKLEKRRFIPTDLGMLTAKELDKFFESIINTTYTSNLESVLDEIAEGHREKTDVLKKFYKHFEPLYKHAVKNMKVQENEKTGKLCPLCGHPLEFKHSSYGRFIGCSDFPRCKYVENIESEKKKKYRKKAK